MKKTIAKLMAAAMMLSAVPAVTLPSFVSKADTIATVAQASVTNTATNTYATQFADGEAKLSAATKGELFAFTLPSGTTLNDFAAAPTQAASALTAGVNVKLQLDSNNLVHVIASMDTSKMTSSQKSDFIKAVQNGTNTFKVTISRKRNRDANSKIWVGSKSYTFQGSDDVVWDLNTQGPVETPFTDEDRMGIIFKQTFNWTSEKTYTIGGYYENGKIKSGVFDQDGYLMDRNVYAKLDKVLSDGMAEVQLLKQDKNEANKLKNNDTLRGQKLVLNTVWISGVEYKVGKLGGQALKEAKMKKIELKNCSMVG
jgi:hypothetical protein